MMREKTKNGKRRMKREANHFAFRSSFFVFSFCLAATIAYAQTWDKYLAPGFTYRMEVDLATPRVIHAVRFSPQSTMVSARSEVGRLKVYSEDVAKSRQTMSELIKVTGAIGGVNGDFFPWSGDPLGLMVRNGELVSAPFPNRSAFAWGKNGSAAGVATLNLGARNGSLGTFNIDGLNQEAGPNQVMVNSRSAGFARTKGPGVHVVLRGLGAWSPRARWEGMVDSVVRAESVSIPEFGAVISASGARGETLARLSPGDPISIDIAADGFDWSQFDQAIGGGPFLVRAGKVSIDWAAQGFTSAFAERRHPRTAVGKTRKGDIWFVTIDGRQAMSAGATLDETARIMLKFGCVEAVNLDGGGSTTFNLLGMTLNRPSDGREREVANGVLFFGKTHPPSAKPLQIKGPAKLEMGKAENLRLIRNGVALPTSGIIWHAWGAGWIDQGGLLRPTGVGPVNVTAWCEGQTATHTIAIVEVPKPPAKMVVKKPKRTAPPRRR